MLLALRPCFLMGIGLCANHSPVRIDQQRVMVNSTIIRLRRSGSLRWSILDKNLGCSNGYVTKSGGMVEIVFILTAPRLWHRIHEPQAPVRTLCSTGGIPARKCPLKWRHFQSDIILLCVRSQIFGVAA